MIPGLVSITPKGVLALKFVNEVAARLGLPRPGEGLTWFAERWKEMEALDGPGEAWEWARERAVDEYLSQRDAG